jgi:hypothetical protein
MEFVLTVPDAGTVSEHADFDLYLPGDGPRPAVVLVPGPTPPDSPAQREWPLFRGYGRLMASRGMVGVVVNVPYHSPVEWEAPSKALPGIVEAVRERPEVDADRVAVWAFSGGGLLVGRWFADSPAWLRCLALTYPLLRPGVDGLRPGRPVVLTRPGLERPEIQATVDAFLAKAAETGTSVHVIDVPNGHHGFDVADHTDESRQAVTAAADFVVSQLSS